MKLGVSKSREAGPVDHRAKHESWPYQSGALLRIERYSSSFRTTRFIIGTTKFQ